MNRRGFLKLLAGTAAASTTAYFLPPICGWHSDVIVHPDEPVWQWTMPEELIDYMGRMNAVQNIIQDYMDRSVGIASPIYAANREFVRLARI